jgi:hypothetical protein
MRNEAGIFNTDICRLNWVMVVLPGIILAAPRCAMTTTDESNPEDVTMSLILIIIVLVLLFGGLGGGYYGYRGGYGGGRIW